jgi:gluconolactonase
MAEWIWELIAKHDGLTEGPAWDGRSLLYSECDANLTWRWDPDSNESSVWRRDTNGGNGTLFDSQGRFFVCEGAGRRVVRYEEGKPTIVIADQFEGRPFNEPNDLAIDRNGRLWFTDPNYGERPRPQDRESVYLVELAEDGASSPKRVTFDTSRPNGVLLSLDQQTLYVAESPRPPKGIRQLRAYPIRENGTFDDCEVLHDFGPHRGVDGMCLDLDGNIVATAGLLESGPGPMIYVFAPNGRVLSTHPAPADRPTNCTYGGPNLDVLFVTFGGGEVYRIPDTNRTGRLLFPPSATS